MQGVTAAGAASMMLPTVNRAFGFESANDRPVFATIGLRNQGWAITSKSLKFADFAALADVDANVLGVNMQKVEKGQGKKPDAYKDYRKILERKDIDAVMIATPDHWHALQTIDALHSGAHVFVEKPTGHTINESRAMLHAARASGRVVQSGLHRRVGPHHVSAMKFLKSGAVGTIGMVRLFADGGGGREMATANSPAPESLDWNRWCGPAPLRPFNTRLHPGG